MKYVLKHFSKYKYLSMLQLTIKVLGTIMDLLLPLILTYILKNVVESKNLNELYFYGAIMLVCSILSLTFNVIANRLAAYIANMTTKAIREEMFLKITKMSQTQIDEITIPSLISRMTTDTYNVYQTLGLTQRLGVRAPILLLCGILLTFSLNYDMALVLLSLIPLLAIVIYLVNKVGVKLYFKVQQSLDKLILIVRENVIGAKVVKALSTQKIEEKKFDNINDECLYNELNASKIMAITNPILNLIMNVGLIFVIFVGAYNVDKHDMQSANITTFLAYFMIILNALLAVTRIVVSFSKASSSLRRIKEVINLDQSLLVVENNETSNSYIEFKDVSFSYKGIENDLENISFTLNKNESLGIIGSTGSGKSTIINLLMRFYDVSDGTIYIDHKDIKSINNKDLKEKFSVVFQQDIIFGGTIFDNIDFGRHLDLESINEAVIHAEASNFVLEEGISKSVSPLGTNLSGGQKQRLLMARAMAKKTDILILDDSSSALDYQTDRKIRNTLLNEFKNQTKIIVSSRISAVKDCNKILVLEEGRLVNFGTHEELLKTSKLYKDIKESQMGGEA